MLLFPGGFICGRPEQPLHRFLQRVPCGGAQIFKEGKLQRQHMVHTAASSIACLQLKSCSACRLQSGMVYAQPLASSGIACLQLTVRFATIQLYVTSKQVYMTLDSAYRQLTSHVT